MLFYPGQHFICFKTVLNMIFDGFWWDFAKKGINLSSEITPKDAKIYRREAIRFGSRTAK